MEDRIDVFSAVTKADDGQNDWEQEDEDKVEQHEDLQVNDDSAEHDNDWTEGFEDSHEGECLDCVEADNDYHDDFGYDVEGVHEEMEHALTDTQEDVEYVKVVAKIGEVFPGPNSEHLKEFIANFVTDSNKKRKCIPVLLMFSDVSWINVQRSHQDLHPVIKQRIIAVNISNIDCKNNDLSHVEEQSVHVVSSTVCIPLELDQRHQRYAFEDVEFVCSSYHFHPWDVIVEELFSKGAIWSLNQSNMRSDLRQDVDGILDFVDFAWVNVLFGAAILVEEVIEFSFWENSAVMLSNAEDGFVIRSQILLVIGMCSRPFIIIEVNLENTAIQ